MARHKKTALQNQDALEEEKSYLQKVHIYIDSVVQKADEDYLSIKAEHKLEYAGSTEERKEAQYFIRQGYSAKEEAQSILTQKESPYFARMDFNVVSNECISKEQIYIGKTSIGDSEEIYVYDWRTPVGERYYVKDTLSFSHENYEYELLLRRGITISNKKLQSINDEYVKGRISYEDDIFDPFLLEVLREKRNEEGLTDIIKTIQGNQHTIIRQPLNQSLIVQGCAGSGKTMILLHRLSYLLYNNKQMRVEDIKIITPNDLFNTQINNLAQILDIGSIDRLTLEAYYLDKLTSYQLDFGKRKLKQIAPDHTTQHRRFYSDEYLSALEQYYLRWYSNLRLIVEEKNIVQLCDQVIHKNSWETTLHQNSIDNLHNLISDTLKKNNENFSKCGLLKTQKEKVLDEIRKAEELLIQFANELDFLEKNLSQTKSLLNELRMEIQEEQKLVRPSKEKLQKQHKELEKILIIKQVNMSKLLSLPQSLDLYIEQKKSRLVDELINRKKILMLKERFGQRVSLAEQQELNVLQQEIDCMYTPEKVVLHMDELNTLLEEKDALKSEIECIKQQREQINMLLSSDENAIDISTNVEYEHCTTKLSELNNRLEDAKLNYRETSTKIEDLHEREISYTETLSNLETKLLSPSQIQSLESVFKTLPSNMLFLLEDIYIPFRKSFENTDKDNFTRRLCKYDLFALLHLCVWYKGPLYKKDRYMYIDEGQDLSLNEYHLIQQINDHKVVFNIYGDIHQDISNTICPWNWSDLSEITSSNYFELNENYRNTVEITNYCNQKLDMKVIPIGISGSQVKETTFDTWITTLAGTPTNKSELSSYTIIVKDEDCIIITKLLEVLGTQNVNTVFKNSDILEVNKINIFSVRMAKGLEFAQVIVFTEKMNLNERYISFTRALNKLIVVND